MKMLRFLPVSLIILVSLSGICLPSTINKADERKDLENVRKFIKDFGPSVGSVPAPASIHGAVRAGDLEAVKKLAESSPSLVNEKDEYGWTALHYVAARGDLKIAGYLLEQGVDVNATGSAEYTPLIVAAIFDRYEMVKYLTEHGADLNARVGVAQWFKSRTREDNTVETVKIGEEYATALDFAANATLRKDTIVEILKMLRQDHLQGNPGSFSDALLVAGLLQKSNKDNRIVDYLKSQGAYSVYKPVGPSSKGIPIKKILLYVVLTGIIISILPLVVRLVTKAILLARLKFHLRRSSKTVVLITSPDKDGAKVTAAYPKEMSAEDRKTVKQALERSLSKLSE